MIVSNFTLAQYAQRKDYRDATSYLLQVTNLDTQDITFAVDCYFSSPPDDYLSYLYLLGGIAPPVLIYNPYEFVIPFRRLQNEAVMTYSLAIRAGATQTFALTKTVRDDRELQGHIELRVPTTRVGRLVRMPQALHNVPVLLHARREDTRHPEVTGIREPSGVVPYTSSTGDNYSSEAVALASGKAENEIVPDGAVSLFEGSAVSKFIADLNTGKIKPSEIAGAALLPDQERVPALIDLLDSLSADEDIDALNTFLRERGTRLRLQRD
jgi:hypothetical protein